MVSIKMKTKRLYTKLMHYKQNWTSTADCTRVVACSPSSEKELNSEKVVDKDKVDSTETQPKRRKAVVFVSSIGKKMDKEWLEKELCCEAEIVSTFHTRENTEAKDQEKYLGKMLSDNMSEEIDLVIVSVGSNDISSLDMTEPRVTLSCNVGPRTW